MARKLKLLWSPEQIAGWLKRTFPDDESFHVSHETIYRSLFIQARGALKEELLQHLRRKRATRRSRHHTQKTDNHGRILDTVSISERPASAEDRAVPGHWERDLISGKGHTYIATLVERHTRYVMLAKVDSKKTEAVINALIKQAHKLLRELYKSLTWDGGKEMADHKRFSLATDIEVYFCDPQSTGNAVRTKIRMACYRLFQAERRGVEIAQQLSPLSSHEQTQAWIVDSEKCVICAKPQQLLTRLTVDSIQRIH